MRNPNPGLQTQLKPQVQNKKLLTPEALILLALSRQTMTVSELHRETGLAFSTLYQNLAELERDGLVERINKHYKLTGEGFEAIRDLADTVHSYVGY